MRGESADWTVVRAMTATLQHRGPDECGVWRGGQVAFGHARLSILDLVGGKQPMSTADGTISITFNGEIFNYIELRENLARKGHKFLTRSDTEVILAAYREYGEDCVQHFNGQWAFAIWDSVTRKLFLSRDRIGVRPLFYRVTPDSFEFASEIKAFLKSKNDTLRVDLRALSQIFTFWVTLRARTFFEGVSQLPPGHSLTVKDGQIRVRPYWKLDYSCTNQNGSELQLAEELLALLEDAVRIRLRSDVPVGAYLSGGLDSSVTTALVSRIAGSRLRTFSVSFKDPEFDESCYQGVVSEFLKTQHHDCCCRTNDIGRVFPDVIWHAEQPILRAAPAPLYLLSGSVRDSGFKVVLTGEGADETLGGYDIFKEAKIRRFWASQPNSKWRPLLLKRLYPYLDNLQRQSPAYLKSFFSVSPNDLHSPFFSHLPRWSVASKLKALFSDEVLAEIGRYDPIAELASELPKGFMGWDEFSRAEYLEFMYLLPGYILSSQGDRMAMAHSIEARYPFLDHRVVEFAAKLSPTAKMKVLDEKHLLKIASAGLIPDEIRNRHKQPYRSPDGKCFVGSNAPEWVEESLSSDRLHPEGIFKPEAVSALLHKFQAGRAIGSKDNMGLIGVLSTQIVMDKFVHNLDSGYTTCIHNSRNRYASTS